MFSIRNQNSIFAPHSTFFSSRYLSFPLYRIWSNFPLLLLFMWTQESVNYTRTFEFPCNLFWEVTGLGSLMSHASFFPLLEDKYRGNNTGLLLVLDFSTRPLECNLYFRVRVTMGQNYLSWVLIVSAAGSASFGAKESQIHWQWIFLMTLSGIFQHRFHPPVALD